jgi:hypothetical protein
MWGLLSAAPADAVELDGGCEGEATSFDADGEKLDTAVAPDDETGTRDDPFKVDYDGTVKYQGSSPEVFHDHSWEIEVFGIPVKDGGSKNGSNKPDDGRTVQVDDYLPFDAPGLYYVSGGITADEGSCDGNMYVKVVGSPVGTLPWIGGLALSAIGLAIAIWSVPRRVLV